MAKNKRKNVHITEEGKRIVTPKRATDHLEHLKQTRGQVRRDRSKMHPRQAKYKDKY